ncbi:MAG: zinc ribbon domain-containing protein [Dehalococcoidia bacterium]|nr:zinc ribbon domain-containing protein [Dehalococcoidia bacterium]
MFCRNCGRELSGTPEFCAYCGAKATGATAFCPSCAAPTTPLAQVCPNCGASLARTDRQETWQPTVGGILCIIAGVFQVLSGMAIALFSGIAGAMFMMGWVAAIGAPLIILGIVAIIGGVYAMKRQAWGLALAGAICALIAPWSVLGILAIVFIAMSKREFS